MMEKEKRKKRLQRKKLDKVKVEKRNRSKKPYKRDKKNPLREDF